MRSPDIKNIFIMTVKGDYYRCIIYGVSKSDAIHLLENYMLDDYGYIQNAFQRNQH